MQNWHWVPAILGQTAQYSLSEHSAQLRNHSCAMPWPAVFATGSRCECFIPGAIQLLLVQLRTVILLSTTSSNARAGVSNPQSVGRMRPRMATNAAQHNIVNLLKTL
uniref:Uncharacterized protein n=1 Tax=Salvator merianae TaxID=96440 RepID=A0A8D0DN17_SALMN